MQTILIDAGPLIALFAADDRHHEHYRDLVLESGSRWQRFITTWPCIVEASYLLATTHRLEMLTFVQQGGVQVFPFDVSHLKPMTGWMRRYSEPGKREMDLADASLYWLATQIGVTEIMTVDRKDFERYRLPDGQAFQII